MQIFRGAEKNKNKKVKHLRSGAKHSRRFLGLLSAPQAAEETTATLLFTLLYKSHQGKVYGRQMLRWMSPWTCNAGGKGLHRRFSRPEVNPNSPPPQPFVVASETEDLRKKGGSQGGGRKTGWAESIFFFFLCAIVWPLSFFQAEASNSASFPYFFFSLLSVPPVTRSFLPTQMTCPEWRICSWAVDLAISLRTEGWLYFVPSEFLRFRLAAVKIALHWRTAVKYIPGQRVGDYRNIPGTPPK